MELAFNGDTWTVGWTALRIGLLPGPRLDLSLSPGKAPPSEAAITAAALAGTRATVIGNGGQLEFTVLGAASPKEGHTCGICGIVLPATLLKWFAEDLRTEGSILIYQRDLEPEGDVPGDPTGWAFLGRLAAGRLAPGSPGLQSAIERALPPASCLWRAVGVDHCHFLDQVASSLAPHVPGLAGWCGVNVDLQPLRFLSAIEPILELDADWSPVPGCLAGRAPGVAGLGPDCLLTRILHPQGSPVRLMAAAASLGRPARAGDATEAGLDAAEVAQLPTLPGAVGWGGRKFFAREVGISATLQEMGQFLVKAELRLGRPEPAGRPHGGMPPQLLSATFKAWRRHRGKPTHFAEVEREPGTWVAIGMDGRPDPELALLAELLLPAAPRADHAVLYIRRSIGDKLRLFISPAAAAACLGGPQWPAQELEGHDLVLNAPRLAMSASASDIPLADADSLVLDGKAHIATMQMSSDRCILDASKVRFSHDVQVDGKLEIQPD